MIYLNAAAFGINVISVSLPARLDGSEEKLKKQRELKEKLTEEGEIFVKVTSTISGPNHHLFEQGSFVLYQSERPHLSDDM